MIIFLVSRVCLGERVQWNQNKLCHVPRATVNRVGQGRLTTILTISISVIKGARKMITFLFPTFLG